MHKEMFISLFYNAALLMALSVVLDTVALRRCKVSRKTDILTGLGLSVIVLAVMLNPWVLREGIVFDTRTMLLSLSGLFFGVVPTIMAAVTATIYRIHTGGSGAIVGVITIVLSSMMGIIWRIRHPKIKKPYNWFELYSLGFITSALLVYSMLGIHYPVGIEVAKTVFWPVMIIYPIATMTMGLILARSVKRCQMEIQLRKLKNEWEFIFHSIPHPSWILNKDHVIVAANRLLESVSHMDANDIIGQTCWEFLNGDSFEGNQESCPLLRDCLKGANNNIEVYIERLGGWHMLSCKPVYGADGIAEQYIQIAIDIGPIKEAERVLSESESKYRLLAETAQDCIYVHNLEGQLSYANKHGLDFLGITDAELADLKFWKYIPKEYHELVKQHAQERKDGYTGPRVYQMELFNFKAERFIVEISSNAIVKDGKIEKILEIVRDITERVAEQKALAQSERRFQMFMDRLPGGAFIKDQDSRVLFLNKYMIDNFGLSSRLGKKPHDLYTKELADKIVAEDRKVMAQGIQHTIERQMHSDRSEHYYETTKFAMLNPYDKDLLGGITVNITDKYKLEEQRKRYAERLEILRGLDSIVLESKSLESVSEQMIEKLQTLVPFSFFSLNTLEGTEFQIKAAYNPNDVFDYIQIYDRHQLSSEMIDLLNTQDTIHIEDITKDTTIRLHPLQAQFVQNGLRAFLVIPLKMQSQLLGFVLAASERIGFFTDEYIEIISEISVQLAIVLNHLLLLRKIQRHAHELEFKVRERTAQLTSANKELEAFSYSVAHDLRAPLKVIEGYSSILIEDYFGDLPSEARQSLEAIVRSTNRMDSLIRELLELAKLNQNEISRTKLNMKKMATDALAQALRSEGDYGFEIDIADLHECIADRSLIQQVWQNLLENAVKFSRPSLRKDIRVGSYTKGDEIVYFVQDHGVGFDPRFADQIFSLFKRVHSEDEFIGTGIGLAVAEKIILRHNGRIWAESEVGMGTIVYFALPLQPPQELD